MGISFRFRRGTAATWASVNPVLAAGEPGRATDTGLFKIGDGSTAWNSLLPAFAGHYDHSGSNPLVEWATVGSASAIHLLAGAGSTAPYVLGIGVDNDLSGGAAANGLTISVKSSKGVGAGVNLETTSGSTALGFLGANFGPGKMVELRKGGNVEATGTLLSLRNDFGATQGDLFEWGTTSGDLKGYIGPTGDLVIQHSSTNKHATRFAPSSGGNLQVMYQYSGSAGLWFSSAIATTSNNLSIQSGAAAAAIGSESLNTLIQLQNGNSLGFFGVTPVTRRSAIASPTGGTTIDSQARTAIDAIRTALSTLGLTS